MSQRMEPTLKEETGLGQGHTQGLELNWGLWSPNLTTTLPGRDGTLVIVQSLALFL